MPNNADGRVVVEITGDDSGLERSLHDADTSMRQASQETNTYTAAMNRLETVMSQCAASLGNVDGTLGEIADGMRETEETADETESTFQKLGSTLKAVFSIALIKEFAQAVYDVGSAYEYSLSKVQSIADTTAVSIDQISDDVLKLSSETGAAAADINEAVYQAISAGVDSAKAVETVEVAVKSAKAGFTDTATAVDGLTTVMNSFKQANLEADEVANKFLITQNLGKTSFGELAASIGNVAPTANAAGVSIDELLSAVASLTANGINTSSAMTGMKAALSNIITPSANAKKMAEELGIQFDAAALKTKGFSQFMSEIAEATEGDTAKMSQLFGSVEALNTMLTLTSEGGAALFDKTMSEMATNTTALDTAYETMTDNLTSKTDILKTAAENFGIDIYQSVSGGLGDAVGTITDYVNRLHDAFMHGGIAELGGELFQIAFDAVSELGRGIADALPVLVPEGLKLMSTITNTVLDNLDSLITTAEKIIEALATALTSDETLDILTAEVPRIFVKLMTALTIDLHKWAFDLYKFGQDLCLNIADGLVHYDWATACEKMMNNLADELEVAQKKVYVLLDDMFNGGNMYGGDIANVVLPESGYAGYLTYMREGIDDTVEMIREGQDSWVEAWEDGTDALGVARDKSTDTVSQWADDQRRIAADYAEACRTASQSAKDLTASAEEASAAVNSATDDAAEISDKVSEKFKEFYDNLKLEKAMGKISDEEYISRLSAMLNSSAEYATAAYTRYWQEVTSVNKKTKDTAQKKVSEDFKAFYDNLKLLLAEGKITQEEYTEQLRKMLESSAEYDSTIYTSYWNEIRNADEKAARERNQAKEKSDKENLDRQKKAAQRELEQLKTDLSGLQSEYRKKLSDLVNERDKFKDKLSANILSTSEESVTDKRTGQTIKKKTDTVADLKKKIDARKRLGSALESLVKKGIPKNLLSELAGMDPEDALRFAEQLNAMDSDKWQNIVDSYNEYEEINRKIAEDIYGPQIKKLNEQFSADLGGVLDGVTGEAAEKGAELISAYVSGVDMSSDKALEDIRKFADDAIKQINDAVSDSTLVGGKMELALDNVDGAGAGENIADQIADGIETNSDRITAAIEAAVERAFGDAKTAVNVKTSAISQNVSASVPAEHQSGGVLSANEKTVEKIVYRDVTLVWKDGQTLAQIVNNENKMTGIQGGTHD